jgi:hypothetical protein
VSIDDDNDDGTEKAGMRLAGRQDHSYNVWQTLSFQSWTHSCILL